MSDVRKIAGALVVLFLVLTSCGEDIEDARLDELATFERAWAPTG
jgi:hypothetical protein